MERELGLIERKQQTLLSTKQSTDSDSDGDDVSIAQTLQTQVDIADKIPEDIAEDVPIFQTLQTQFIKTNSERDVIGKRVAKDFGSPGVFLGTIMNVEYDSEDVAHEAPFYVVEYTDGDREDLNASEVEYAMELAFQIELDEEDELEMEKDKAKHLGVTSSEDEESYRPPKVYFINILHLVYSNIKSFLRLHLLETAKKE